MLNFRYYWKQEVIKHEFVENLNFQKHHKDEYKINLKILCQGVIKLYIYIIAFCLFLFYFIMNTALKNLLLMFLFRNIFLRQNMIKVGDFGISRILMGTTDLASTFTGTPYYMSPEVLKHEGYNSKSDIW